MAVGALRDDYRGGFDPDLGLGSFSRKALARLGREYLLLGHLSDRVALPLVIQRFGDEALAGLAIDEWMAASPIYSRRMQRALGFEGADVGTVFKNLQLDIGSPPQFMDFQFRLDGPESGEFWLPHCGALLDVEPFGEQRVRTMCHEIEDPTFDATAAAVHPRMKMRPIHRPPRVPSDRAPHCRWKVFIDESGSPAEAHPNRGLIEATRLAGLAIDGPPTDGEPGGRSDYSGAFDPGFQLEDLGHRALVIALQEFCVQIHLLTRSFLMAIAGRQDAGAAIEIGRLQWEGIAALAAERLHRALDCGERDGIEAVAKVFQLHPHFHPRAYVDFGVEVRGPNRARIWIRDCEALEEGDDWSWLSDLGPGPHPALDAIAAAVDPRARCHAVSDTEGARLAWDVVIDASVAPRKEPVGLKLASLSRGAAFEFRSVARPPRP